MTAEVYAIRNIETGRIYIGSSKSIATRWKLHRDQLRLGKHVNRRLSSDYAIYGPDAFEFSLLEEVEPIGNALLAAERRHLSTVELHQTYHLPRRVWRPDAGIRCTFPHLRAMMQEQGLTMLALSLGVGIPAERLRMARNGHARGFEQLELDKICRTLGVSVGELLEYQPDEKA